MIESFATEDEIQTMTKRMEQLVDEFDPSSTASIFSTKNQVTYLLTLYLLLFRFMFKVLCFSICSDSLFIFNPFQQQLTDNYFFESAERVSFFFEGIEIFILFYCKLGFLLSFINLFYVEKAFGDDGNLKQPKQVSLNKVGHGKNKPSIFWYLFALFWTRNRSPRSTLYVIDLVYLFIIGEC